MAADVGYRVGNIVRVLVVCTMVGILGLGHSARADTCKKLVATGNPEYAPYLWRDTQEPGKLIGANADLMQLLAQALGIPIEVRYVGTWARVQEEAKIGRIDLIAGAFFTQARLDYMDYFHPPFQGTRSVVWSAAAKPVPFKAWDDLRGLHGLTVINNSFGEAFDQYAKANLKITTVPTLEQAIQMLALARADYMIYEEAPGLAYMAKLNISGLKIAATEVSSEALFLTFSHKSPCNTPEMRALITKAVLKLNKEKAMEKLIEPNIQLWRKQSKS